MRIVGIPLRIVIKLLILTLMHTKCWLVCQRVGTGLTFLSFSDMIHFTDAFFTVSNMLAMHEACFGMESFSKTFVVKDKKLAFEVGTGKFLGIN